MLVKNEFSSIADGSSYSLSIEDDSEKDLYEHIGESFLIRELIFRMITVSSNFATNLLIERVTPELTTRFMQALGTNDVIVRRGVEDNQAFRLGLNNTATARGLMQILLKLAKREVVSPQDSDEMIEILLQQKFNEMIPAQLPCECPCGAQDRLDGKILSRCGNCLSAKRKRVCSGDHDEGNENEQEAHSFVASLAKMVYDNWK